MATPQTQAIQIANTVISTAAQVQTLYQNIGNLIQQYNDIGASTYWAQFSTCATNSDGSLGSADGSPNTAHVMDTRVVTGINRAISANALSALVSVYESFKNSLDGTADWPQQGGVRQIIDEAVGG